MQKILLEKYLLGMRLGERLLSSFWLDFGTWWWPDYVLVVGTVWSSFRTDHT
jgi:hypothetical protein